MMKYRKKPVVIEAVQLAYHNYKSNYKEIENWADDKVSKGGFLGGLIVNTLEGEMQAMLGDWIIKGVKGEFYPCKDDIFQMTYEKVVQINDDIEKEGLLNESALQTRLK